MFLAHDWGLIVHIEYCFFDVDKLGIVWRINEKRVNYLGNFLPMLARCMLPALNKACNHLSSFSQAIHQTLQPDRPCQWR